MAFITAVRNRLVLDFSWKKVRCREYLRLPATREGRTEARRIKKQIEGCKRGGGYSFPGFNCATQASICLNAGVPYNMLHKAVDAIAGLVSPTAFLTQTSTINTPWNLFLYAKALAIDYA